METLFICPVCGKRLKKEGFRLLCESSHSFDLAREGYVNLLTSNNMHSREPGDDALMVSSRRAFLEKDYYRPLAQRLSSICAELSGAAPVVIDAGCGEGYYTKAVYDALTLLPKEPHMYAVDISKRAVRLASRLCKNAGFAVASVFSLPFPDKCADILVNCFSPLAAEEFSRVLKPGGYFLYVVPDKRHLWELKELLYEQPYENERKLTQYPGFTLNSSEDVSFTVQLDCNADLKNLFSMTPYCYKTPREGVMRLDKTDALSVTAEFIIYVYKKD